jgi:hypothetical protein
MMAALRLRTLRNLDLTLQRVICHRCDQQE